MKRKIFQIILLSFFVQQSVVAQNIQTVIKTEALKMAKALAALDLETYASYTYPTLVTDKNGKEKIKQGVDSIQKYREQFGIKVKSVLLGNPSAVVTYKGVQQCTLPQTMTVEAFMGSMETETTLIGLSNDGKKWYFIDALMYRNKETKSKLPELSPDLVIPPMKQPKINQAETKKTN